MDRREFVFRALPGVSGALLVGGTIGCASAPPPPPYRGDGNPRVMGIVRDLQERTNRFTGTLDRAIEKGRGGIDGSRREEELRSQARRLEGEIDQVQRELNRHQDFRDVRGNVRQALEAGRDIDRTMRNRKMGKATEKDWMAVRDELNALADAYDLPRL